jgi:hypothetical protein
LLDRITPLQIAVHAATRRRQRRDRSPPLAATTAAATRSFARAPSRKSAVTSGFVGASAGTGAGGAMDANVGVGSVIGASAGARGTSAGLDGVAATGAHTPVLLLEVLAQLVLWLAVGA